mmetsp:Transcript_6415/g.12241  ORF Transcript_6415/g.12241 Transcript_6415/m.12241 type:complete len:355 (+) Transcript_6415:531-1595(+)
MTVWCTPDLNSPDPSTGVQRQLSSDPSSWTRIYAGQHGPSPRTLVPLPLDPPLKLAPGSKIGLYIHSTLPGDQALVYDNYCGRGCVYTDEYVTIHPGHSHVSNRPFGSTSMWGWGSAWRSGRVFVGRMEYGVRYKLWGPRVHSSYGSSFRRSTLALFMLQRRDECVWSTMPDDVIMYVLNMCPWDWFLDSVEGVERERGREREPVVQRNRGDGGGYYYDEGDDTAPGEPAPYEDDDDDDASTASEREAPSPSCTSSEPPSTSSRKPSMSLSILLPMAPMASSVLSFLAASAFFLSFSMALVSSSFWFFMASSVCCSFCSTISLSSCSSLGAFLEISMSLFNLLSSSLDDDDDDA